MWASTSAARRCGWTPASPSALRGSGRAELEANRFVWRDLPVQITYPSREELAHMTYRSKKEIEGQVRIVTIPGADACACCGTHTASHRPGGSDQDSRRRALQGRHAAGSGLRRPGPGRSPGHAGAARAPSWPSSAPSPPRLPTPSAGCTTNFTRPQVCPVRACAASSLRPWPGR